MDVDAAVLGRGRARGGGGDRYVGHEERDHFRKTMQVGLRGVGARFRWRDGVESADVGEKRRRKERRPCVRWDVVRNRVADPDESSCLLLDIRGKEGGSLGDARILEECLLTIFG